MRWSTHAAIGVDLAGVVMVATMPSAMVCSADWVGAVAVGAVALGALLGSLLPDLDARQSKIKYLKFGQFRPFYLLSTLTYERLGHRGVLHSLPGLVAMALLFSALAPWCGVWYVLGICLGYGAHLLADSATVTGIPWLFPKKRRYHLTRGPWRVVTGSLAEEGIFAISASVALFLLVWLLKQSWLFA